MNMTKKGLSLLRVVLIGMVLKAISFYKISFILGSQTAFFNGSSVAIPLVGFFAGSIGSGILFLVRMTNWGLFTSGSLHLLSFVIPGFCASLYWTTQKSSIRFWLPLLCMAAFVAHPVGRDAFVYTFYWFIPLVLYVAKRQNRALASSNVWTDALGSTFVAHAVGSVIWLYTTTTTASLWLSLLPVVAVERLLCAAGMVSICYASMMVNHISETAARRIAALIQQYRQA